MKSYHIAHTDLVVSRIAYGCAGLGTWDNAALDANTVAAADRLIKTALDQGITLFDHADLYAFGKSEAVFGEVLKTSPAVREKIVLQSKCGQVFPKGWRPGDPIKVDLRGEHIVSAVEGSLKRLCSSYLDILMLHAPSPLIRPQEIAQAFEDLHRMGKVRYFGVSNYSAAQIKLLKKFVRQPLIVNQVHLGLLCADLLIDGMEFALALAKGAAPAREEHTAAGTFDYCRVQDMQIQAWSPLGADLFAVPTSRAPELNALVQSLTALAQLTNTTSAAVALAWLLHHPAGIVPIIGSTNSEHIVGNCAADRIMFRDEDWNDLFIAAADLSRRST
jgi:predicted oxidoreductase